jgi:predicted deacylase
MAALVCVALVLPLYAGLQAAAGNVNGGWAFVLNTESGDRNANATLKVTGKAVSGTFGEKAEVKGTFADDALDLAFPFESPEAGSGTLAIKAKLANDELTGTWTFLQYSGTLKATRVPPAK